MPKPKFARVGKKKVIGSAKSPAKRAAASKAVKSALSTGARAKAKSQMAAFKKKYGKKTKKGY